MIMHNLVEFCHACETAEEPQTELLVKMTPHKERAEKWVTDTEVALAEASAKCYDEARKQRDPMKRKASLREVTNCMERHRCLLEKLVELGKRMDDGADTPLVIQIKENINADGKATLRLLSLSSRTCTAEEVADAIHGIYVTATDLADASILVHAEACIADVLQDTVRHKKRNKFGLKELGAVLVRELPRGGEIIANQPLFAQVNRMEFQQMTGGKTTEGTVKELKKLNNFSDSMADAILKVTQRVYSTYDTILRRAKFYVDLPQIATTVKANTTDIPAVIGGAFAVWSLGSVTDQCETPLRPLPAQVVAIVRLLGLERRHLSSTPSSNGFFNFSWMGTGHTDAIDASHLAQVKTGQGKSVILGVLATVLSLAGFRCVFLGISVSCTHFVLIISQPLLPILPSTALIAPATRSTFRDVITMISNLCSPRLVSNKWCLTGHSSSSRRGSSTRMATCAL
jgi:hypothetical protein